MSIIYAIIDNGDGTGNYRYPDAKGNITFYPEDQGKPVKWVESTEPITAQELVNLIHAEYPDGVTKPSMDFSHLADAINMRFGL
jgi:hypothetical protein